MRSTLQQVARGSWGFQAEGTAGPCSCGRCLLEVLWESQGAIVAAGLHLRGTLVGVTSER